MKQLKEYENLYRMYCRGTRKFRIGFFVCLILFVLAFATFFVDNFPFGLTIAMMGMIFLAILFGILWLIFHGRIKKQLKLFSPQQLRMINEESALAQKYDGWIVTSQAVLYTKRGLEFVSMANLLWIYADVTVTSLYGLIPIHKDTMLMFAGKNQKKYGYRIKNNQKAFQFLQSELLKYRLDIVFGYENGMDEIYKKDLNRMIAFSQECAEKRQKEIELAQREEI